MKFSNSRPVVLASTILVEARGYLAMALQWSRVVDPAWSESVTSNLHKAEALVELIEEFDCGSVGGFGKNQPENQNLFERWEWLYLKYAGNPKWKRRTDHYDYDTLKAFYARQRQNP